MKHIVNALLFLIIAGTCVAYDPSEIVIVYDDEDCVSGWLSMDVAVNVDGEIFKFDPSCKFSFNETFKTKKGFYCKIDAGMCSSFSPKNRIEVNCSNLGEAAVFVKCP